MSGRVKMWAGAVRRLLSPEAHREAVALMDGHLRKLYRSLWLVVLITGAVELAMAVRGLMIFDLSRQKHRLYLASYLFLAAVCGEVLLGLWLGRDREKYPRMLVGQCCLFSVCLMSWAALISCIDGVASGDSGLMVYIMVSTAVAVLTRMRPVAFVPVLLLSAGALLYGLWRFRGAAYSSGFYLNFMVFLVLTAFLNVQSFRISRREHKTTQQLITLSETDQLTGVYNRRRLDEQVSRRCESGESFLFLLMDMDDFKAVNDTHGHGAGDSCLILIAEKLKEHFGPEIYRFGGDEFAVITGMDARQAKAQVEQINRELAGAYGSVDLHLSAGIYQTTEQSSAGEVFIRADRALYQAKDNGKNGCVIGS